MPSPQSDVLTPAVISGLDQHPPDVTLPPTPPADLTEVIRHATQNAMPPSASIAIAPVCDNTAVGMAYGQEDTMYISPVTTPDALVAEIKDAPNQDKVELAQDAPTPDLVPTRSTRRRSSLLRRPVKQSLSSFLEESENSIEDSCPEEEEEEHDLEICQDVPIDGNALQRRASTRSRPLPESSRQVAPGLAPIDLTLTNQSEVQPWDFSSRRPPVRYPSSLFQAYSNFIGTQQSDKHRYEVEVTILTVDMDQGSLSGYLLIHGLTPEHAKLQTFFTGEIIGSSGTNKPQRHSFRTTDPTWGANEKVDLLHWARFPPFRHLSSHAKRDLGFEWPLNGTPWWEEQVVFMRWKEHFLVPDHRTRSIQGASFEGFYYICMDMISGDIDGIYFHAKSERDRYQQLKLTHETRHGAGAPLVQPVMEFR